MKFFIDTANVEDIKKANDMGVICGVTTNPSLIAKEGRDFNEVIKEIASIVDGPESGLVSSSANVKGVMPRIKKMPVSIPTKASKINTITQFPPITINLDRKAGQPVRLSLHLVPKLQ